jgi:replicative DNA helicase
MNQEIKHADEATERAVIGAILQDADLFDMAKDLDSGHFALSSHREIFALMMTMAEKGTAVDLTTVNSGFRRINRLDAIGGAAYLPYCMEGVYRVSRHTFASYKRILREKAALRKILSFTADAVARVEGGHDAEEILSDLIAQANSNRTEGGKRPARTHQ